MPPTVADRLCDELEKDYRDLKKKKKRAKWSSFVERIICKWNETQRLSLWFQEKERWFPWLSVRGLSPESGHIAGHRVATTTASSRQSPSGRRGETHRSTSTMSGHGCKDDSLDFGVENRTDSGIDSYRSILKSEEPQESGDISGPREKFSAVEERLDSAYGSSSITGESLSELVQSCEISSVQEEQETQSSELSEQEENLLTTITEEGDT